MILCEKINADRLGRRPIISIGPGFLGESTPTVINSHCGNGPNTRLLVTWKCSLNLPSSNKAIQII